MTRTDLEKKSITKLNTIDEVIGNRIYELEPIIEADKESEEK